MLLIQELYPNDTISNNNRLAFDEARVSVGTYLLYALYTHTQQRIRLYAMCTHRIHIATYYFVCDVHTSHTHRNVIVCMPLAHIAFSTSSTFHRIPARSFTVKSTLILPAATFVSCCKNQDRALLLLLEPLVVQLILLRKQHLAVSQRSGNHDLRFLGTFFALPTVS